MHFDAHEGDFAYKCSRLCIRVYRLNVDIPPFSACCQDENINKNKDIWVVVPEVASSNLVVHPFYF